MGKFKNIFLFLLSICILSCSDNNTQEKLNDISTYVCSNPDSARKALNKICKSELTTEQLRAHHALLTCESEYFHKRKVNDSTLNTALKYFVNKEKGSISQQMETKLLSIYTSVS